VASAPDIPLAQTPEKLSRALKPSYGKAMTDRPVTPLLDTISSPADIRALPKGQLLQLSDELRQEMISVVSVTGGHLGAGLGVVELTVAIHHVFDTPRDTLSCLPVQGVSATNSFLPRSDRNQSTGSAPGQSRRHGFKTTVDHALIRGLVTAGPDASRSCLCLETSVGSRPGC
jgi:hypothetical protein